MTGGETDSGVDVAMSEGRTRNLGGSFGVGVPETWTTERMNFKGWGGESPRISYSDNHSRKTSG